MEVVNAPATYALIVVNVVISLYALYGDGRFFDQFMFQVRAVTERDEQYRIVTSSFLHANLPHLLLNMLTLYFFGPVVEATLGKLGFLVVYFGAIIASGFLSLWLNRKSPLYSSVGASDAVSGVVLSYCCFYPLDKIYVMMIPVGIPAFLYGLMFMFISAQLMGREDRVIAHEGHLGGAVAGAVLTVIMQPYVVTRFFS
ncbi:MAG: rhomboid family intramembrane serine protease [Parvularculaceae bacterium]|nr:rhomboid family intramembrane serine protease [Parvularculaceae bacterium]